MKQYCHHLIFAGCICLILCGFTSCKKSGDSYSPDEDTLAQTIYIIKTDGTPSIQDRILLAPFDSHHPLDSGTVMIMNGAGGLLMQKRTPTSVMDFRRWEINGHERYTWYVCNPAQNIIHSAGDILSGYVVIADENLNELTHVSLLAKDDITTAKNEGLDGHDFILLDDNHYIAMAYYERSVNNIPSAISGGATKVTAPVIQEVKDGQVIWQWVGSDYPEFYSTSVEGNKFANDPEDYMHMNSMFVDPKDNNLVCSFRNMDQVLKIDRHNGDIIWRLGGSNSDFALGEDQKFLRQHHVTITDDGYTLLLFDNGQITQRPWSRILEFQLNESARQVTGFRSFRIPEPFTQFTGSVQKIGDHYFIGGGTADYVLDINYLTGEKSLEMTGSQLTYRAFRY